MYSLLSTRSLFHSVNSISKTNFKIFVGCLPYIWAPYQRCPSTKLFKLLSLDRLWMTLTGMSGIFQFLTELLATLQHGPQGQDLSFSLVPTTLQALLRCTIPSSIRISLPLWLPLLTPLTSNLSPVQTIISLDADQIFEVPSIAHPGAPPSTLLFLTILLGLTKAHSLVPY